MINNHKHITTESRKFEVLGTRDFILKYRKFKLKRGRHKNNTPQMIIIIFFPIKHRKYNKLLVFICEKETSQDEVSLTHTKHVLLCNSFKNSS